MTDEQPISRPESSPEERTTAARARSADLRFERVTAAGFDWNVGRAGSGPPVLFLHGFPEHHGSWSKNIGAFVDAGYSVIVPDLKGYGRTDKPKPGQPLGDYRLSQMAVEVGELIVALGYERIDIVGHDWGGIILSSMTAICPERVGRAVIVNAPYRRLVPWRPRHVYFFNLPSLPERRFWRQPVAFVKDIITFWAARPEAFTDEDIVEYTRAFQRGGSISCALAYYRSLRKDLPFIGRAITDATLKRSREGIGPALVVFGDQDPIMPPAVARMAHADLPGSQLAFIAGAGHFPHREAPDEFNRIVIAFLEGTEPR